MMAPEQDPRELHDLSISGGRAWLFDLDCRLLFEARSGLLRKEVGSSSELELRGVLPWPAGEAFKRLEEWLKSELDGGFPVSCALLVIAVHNGDYLAYRLDRAFPRKYNFEESIAGGEVIADLAVVYDNAQVLPVGCSEALQQLVEAKSVEREALRLAVSSVIRLSSDGEGSGPWNGFMNARQSVAFLNRVLSARPGVFMLTEVEDES
jgi:hypothetical protein